MVILCLDVWESRLLYAYIHFFLVFKDCFLLISNIFRKVLLNTDDFEIDLFHSKIRPKQVLLLGVRKDLGLLPIKIYIIFPRISESK